MLRAISLAIGVIIAIIVVSMGYGLDTWQFWSIILLDAAKEGLQS